VHEIQEAPTDVLPKQTTSTTREKTKRRKGRRMRQIHYWVAYHIGTPLAYTLFRLLGLMLRHRQAGHIEEIRRQLDQGQRYVAAFYHGDSVLMAWEMLRSDAFGQVHIMVSRSRDGDVMARFLKWLGACVVRGSSSKGGSQALLEITRRMSRHGCTGLAVDGPRGPRHHVKEGALLVAKRTGMPILPLVGGADRKWTAKSWDRMEFPRPFSQTAVYYGEPLQVPPHANAQQIEDLRQELSRRLQALKEQAG